MTKKSSPAQNASTTNLLPDAETYRRVLLAAGYVIFTTDARGVFTSVTDSVTTLMGYTPNEVVGSYFGHFVHPDWRDRVDAFFADQRDRHLVETTFEFVILTKSGEERWVEQTTLLIENNGEAVSTQCVTRDITAYRRAEAARNEQERMYRALFENTNDGVFLLSLDWKIQMANQKAADLWGYSLEELIGMSPQMAVPEEELADSTQKLSQVVQDEIIPLYERTFVRKDGTRVFTEVNIALVRDSAGQPRHIQSVIRDITARKQQEQAVAAERNLLKTLINNIPDHISFRDLNGRYLLTNQAYAQQVGSYDSDFLVGKNIADYFPPASIARYTKEDMYILKTGEGLLNEVELDALGGRRWYSVSKVPVRDNNENIVGLVSIGRDISDLKQAEQESRSREQLYRTLARNLPQSAVYLYDTDLRFLIAEGPMLAEWNLSSEKMERRTLEENVSAESYPMLREYALKALNGEETHIERLFGEKNFAVSFIPVRDNAGRIFAGMILAQDITERKKAAQELRKRDELYRTLTRNLPNGVVYLFDTELRLLVAEGPALRAAGITSEMIEGKLLQELLPPEAYDILGPAYMRGLKGEAHTLEYLLGGIIYELHVHPIRDESGNIGAVMALSQDITERKRADDELRKRDELYRTLTRNLPNSAVYLFDTELRLLVAEGPALRAVGITSEMIEGKLLRELIPPEAYDILGAAYMRGLKGEAYTIEYPLGPIIYELHIHPVYDLQGNIYQVLGLSQDITERKKIEETLRAREQLYRTLARNLPNSSVYLVDQDLKCLVSEGPLLEQFGATPGVFEGKYLHDFMPPAVYSQWYAWYSGALKGEAQSSEHHSEGRYYTVQVHPVRDDQGAIFAAIGVSTDITERKKTEEVLRARDQLYRTLARNWPNSSVFLMDTQLKCLITEGTLLEKFGAKPEHFEGRNLDEIMPPEYFPSWHNWYTKALNGEIQVDELSYGGRDFAIQVHPVRDDQGAIFAAIGVSTDITERKRVEKQLAYNEQRYLSLLWAIPDIILVIDKEGNYQDFHPSTEASSGQRSLIDMLGPNLSESRLPQDFIDSIHKHKQIVHDTLEIETYRQTLWLGETEKTFEIRMIALNRDETLVIIRDVSQLKQAEAELQRNLEDMTMLYDVEDELTTQLNIAYVQKIALDRAMRMSQADAGFIALWEMDKEELQLAHQFGYPDDKSIKVLLQNLNSMVAQATRTGKARLVKSLDEEKGYVNLLEKTQVKIIIPLISRDRLIGVLNLETQYPHRFTDDIFARIKLVTGRIAVALDNAWLHRRTEEQYEEVRRLEQLKTDMIRIASHDLRNPLATMMGYLEMLQWELDAQGASPQKEQLGMIENAAKRMQKIVTDILSLERIEEAAQSSTIELFDLAKLVETVFLEHTDAAQRRHQTLQLDVPPRSVYVEGDPIQLHEAVDNLITNALKYTPEAGKIQVSLSIENDQAHFRVTDSGFGIPTEAQVRLFEPFYRARTRETRKIEGTGLGLHLVKNVIERHHGKMKVDSVYGKGSTFGFDLPLAQNGEA